MISFWERESLLATDVAIIGGGIVGLSVAASLAESNPKLKITVFERSVLSYGASTRNAGFACFGSLTEVLSDIEIMGTEAARELVFQRWIGLKITRQRLGDEAIGFEPNGGFELIREKEQPALQHIDEVNELLADFLPDYITDANDLLSPFGLKPDKTQQLVQMVDEGQVDTGKLMASLERYVLSLGVIIRAGASVCNFHESGDSVVLTVNDQSRGKLDFEAKQVVVCSNAFVRDLVPETDLHPGRGQVFATHPISNLPFKGNLHIDEGFYYLRSFGDRLIFGGARNFDFDTENTTVFKLNEQIHDHLEEYLSDLFPALEFEVDHRWAGIMAFGSTKQPIVKPHSDRILLAVKMGGMGIALAGNIGETVKEMLSS
jgi:glycine/D-amino acid oxidase-like deaminating enzyme